MSAGVENSNAVDVAAAEVEPTYHEEVDDEPNETLSEPAVASSDRASFEVAEFA